MAESGTKIEVFKQQMDKFCQLRKHSLRQKQKGVKKTIIKIQARVAEKTVKIEVIRG